MHWSYVAKTQEFSQWKFLYLDSLPQALQWTQQAVYHRITLLSYVHPLSPVFAWASFLGNILEFHHFHSGKAMFAGRSCNGPGTLSKSVWDGYSGYFCERCYTSQENGWHAGEVTSNSTILDGCQNLAIGCPTRDLFDCELSAFVTTLEFLGPLELVKVEFAVIAGCSKWLILACSCAQRVAWCFYGQLGEICYLIYLIYSSQPEWPDFNFDRYSLLWV